MIPSPIISGHWAKAIYNFNEEKGNYQPADYFVVIHANQIVVLSQKSEGYFNAIEYQIKQGCIGCSETDIYFYRIDKRQNIHPFPVKNSLSGCW